jgi:hypothetical protein
MSCLYVLFICLPCLYVLLICLACLYVLFICRAYMSCLLVCRAYMSCLYVLLTCRALSEPDSAVPRAPRLQATPQPQTPSPKPFGAVEALKRMSGPLSACRRHKLTHIHTHTHAHTHTHTHTHTQGQWRRLLSACRRQKLTLLRSKQVPSPYAQVQP